MYRPYVLQGIVMIVVGISIFLYFEIPAWINNTPHWPLPAYGFIFAIAFGAYRIYEAFK